MTEKLVKNSEYRSFIQEVKQRIQSAQIKAAISVNQALLQLYWDLAEQIVLKQQATSWGDRFLEELSRDLKAEFPEMKGFSKRNLELMRQWYRFWQEEAVIAQQLVSQIPWGHNLMIVSRSKDVEEALFYVQKTMKDVVVEYALRDLNKPIGVSEYLPQDLLADWRSALPTIEEIEAELGKEVADPSRLEWRDGGDE
jgi:predicted nuclease of restriction endonuclease-like (RecB) superfamily